MPQSVVNNNLEMCYLQKCLVPPEEFVKGLPKPSDTHVTKIVARGLLITSETFAGGLSHFDTKEQPFCNTSKENKIQIKKQRRN